MRISLEDAAIVFPEGRTTNPYYFTIGNIEREIQPKAGDRRRMYVVRVFYENDAIYQVLESGDIFRLSPLIIFLCPQTTTSSGICAGIPIDTYTDELENEWMVVAQVDNHTVFHISLDLIIIPSVN